MKLHTTGNTKLHTFQKSLDARNIRLNTVQRLLDQKNPETHMDAQTRQYWRSLPEEQKGRVCREAMESLQSRQDVKPRPGKPASTDYEWRSSFFSVSKPEIEQRGRADLRTGASPKGGDTQKVQKTSRTAQQEYKDIQERRHSLWREGWLQDPTVSFKISEKKQSKPENQKNRKFLDKEKTVRLETVGKSFPEKPSKSQGLSGTEEKEAGSKIIPFQKQKETSYQIGTVSRQTPQNPKTSASSGTSSSDASTHSSYKIFTISEQTTASAGKTAGASPASFAVKAAKKAADLAKTAAREALGKEEEKREFAASSMVTSEGFTLNAADAMGAPRLQQAIAAVIAVAAALIQSALAFLLPFLLILALIASVVAGILSLLFGGAASGFARANVSAACEQYRPVVEKYAAQYGMDEYVELILAVMMQESGGTLPDVMQAAEGAYNTQYPRVPNGITDPEYSIQCGIQELKHALELAGCMGPTDMEHIKLALQGYNFGPGYITWALENYGGYSESNAADFSDRMAAKMGWSGYGDKQYVAHVLRYYEVSYGAGNGEAIINEGMKYMGMPYVYGGSSPETSFDCSGFVYYVYNQCGYHVPRYTAQGFYDVSIKIPEEEAQPGDLVFFEHTYDFPERITHIGIYIGNGQMMHFGNPGKISPITIFGDKFVGFGRLQPSS